MQIAMSGAGGFIGSHLANAFSEKGWRTVALGRNQFALDDQAFAAMIEGADAVINLAGASIAARWTEEYKKIISSSRIETTEKLFRALKQLRKKPRVFVSTSAIGIYGTKGVYTENDTNYATGFLGKVAVEWEQAAMRARDIGIRTVVFRLGVVLGMDGGALQKMLMPFKMGVGGVVGSGNQSFSWVHIEDLVRAYFTVIEEKRYEGIYNLTAPNPTTNKGLTDALGNALGKPTFMRVPAFVLRLQLGEAANLLLEGQSVLPKRLLESGFTFTFSDIREAIANLVRTPG